MTRFILIRHATNDTVGHRIAGRMEGVHLNDNGKAQAQELVHRLADVSIDALYSSPLERAKETAAPLAENLNLAVEVDEAFVEINYGDWTGRTIEEIRSDEIFRQYNLFRSATRIPGGEMMMEAQTRVVTGLQNLYRKHADSTVAIVSHGDIIKSAVAWYAGIHIDMFQRVEISPASVNIIEVYDETARVMLVNHCGPIS